MCNQAPRGSKEMARDLTPLDQICHFPLLPSFYLLPSQVDPLSSIVSPLVTSFHLTQVSSPFSSFLQSSR